MYDNTMNVTQTWWKSPLGRYSQCPLWYSGPPSLFKLAVHLQ